MNNRARKLAIFGVIAALVIAAPLRSRADVPDVTELDLSTPQGFMAGIGFDESYYKMFDDDKPINEEEQEPLIRLLSRIRRPKAKQIEAWLQLTPDWRTFVDQPAESRLDCFLLVGRVVKIESRPILPELGAVYEVEDFYSLEVIPNDSDSIAAKRVILLSLTIPERFKALVDQPEGAVDEPISAAAYFLKRTTPADAAEVTIAAVTERVSWHPDHVNESLGVNPGQIELAARGVDIGQFDTVRDRAAFTGLENESFYQCMAAISSIPQEQLAKVAAPVSLPQLLTDPGKYRGAAVRVSGTVRRITKIVVDQETARRRGLEYYYEINLFIPLATPIVSQAHADTTTRKEFRDSYPVVLCSRELPAGAMEGEDLHLQVTADCVFYKDWAYRTPFMSTDDPNRRQISPLFICNRPQIVEGATAAEVNSIAVWILIFAVLASSLGIGAGVMLAGKRKRR